MTASQAQALVTTGATWRYRKGTNEFSAPVEFWRNRAFTDASWSTGPAPFHYGEGLTEGTVLPDMAGRYTSIALRKTFTVSGLTNIASLALDAICDDGFIVWINGNEVARFNVPVAPMPYNGVASASVAEPVTLVRYALPGATAALVEGANVLAVQVFNSSSTSSDLQFDAQLEAQAADNVSPAVAKIEPPAGEVPELSRIVVSFNKPVFGVDASDLWLNGVPAKGVSGTNSVYTFTFDPQPAGLVAITWYAGHGITDQNPALNKFDDATASAIWEYRVVDRAAPVVSALNPPARAALREFSQVEVAFSEPVLGVEATDLLAGGKPAREVAAISGSVYLFKFDPVTNGPVSLAWAAGNGIHDEAEPANAFAGSPWTYTVAASAALGDVIINEFLVSTAGATGVRDEDGDFSDWIELYNRGNASVNLEGWGLTDDVDQPAQWTLPAVTLGAKQYLVIFASGKDRKPVTTGSRLHTNFKLGIYGEYLGLYSPESPRRVVSELAPGYPAQRNNYSYGLDGANVWRHFRSPTPGAANAGTTVAEAAAEPHFSVPRGFFNQPFNLILSSPTPGALVRYTLDGSEPTETNGIPYLSPINIRATAVVRAVSFRTNSLPSRTITQTYFMSLPAARMSLPVISIVTASNNLRGPTGIMEINPRNTTKRGIAWERPSSVEYIRPDGEEGFQIDCGLRVQGGDYIRGRYNPNTTVAPEGKFSFRLYFRGDYGEGKLKYPLFGDMPVKEFDRVVLRAGMNDPTNPFVVDELERRLLKDTGQPTAVGTFANLFVNGVYKGYYNPSEGYEEDFLQSWHGGGPNWDLITQGRIANSGDANAFGAMYNYINRTGANTSMALPANYSQAMRLLDMTNFVDYLLVNTYGGTGDWPQNNWRAARERVPGALFRFYMWDAEWSFGNLGRAVTLNTLTVELANGSEIANLYQRLRASPEFKLLFADRVQKHFFNNGALTDPRISARFSEMKESLRGVIPNMQNTILTSWVPRRRGIIFGHLQSAGLLASTNAPVFSQHGGAVPRGYGLGLSALQGTIYYTTNGMDPRLMFSSAVSPAASAYSGAPIPLWQNTRILARSLNGTNWSAVTDATFTVGGQGIPVRITEIMYAPTGGDAYEFLELRNLGGTPVDLTLMSFEGINYTFPDGSILAPGATLVLGSGSDPAAFDKRYPGVRAYGRFGGSLSNNGEKLVLKDRFGRIVTAADYRRGAGWPKEADGGGSSLEVINAADEASDPSSWHASGSPGGSPGEANSPLILPLIRLSEVMAENFTTLVQEGSHPDWVELHNAGSSPANLGGWSLSDNADARKFVFPANTTVPAGGYLLVWCDSATATPGLHTGFALDKEGDRVFLYDPGTNRVDAVSFGPQIADYSLARVNDQWVLGQPTPDRANIAAATGSVTNLVINEWLANPAAGNDDWIELFNRDLVLPVALKGLYLSTSNHWFQLNLPSFVAPGGHVKLTADEQATPGHVDFKLPAAGGLILLTDAGGGELSKVIYLSQLEGISEGRIPDGSTNIGRFASPSPASANQIVAYSGAVLNEVLASHANPDDMDWIELYNPGEQPADLGGMSLGADGPRPGQWVFPAGVSVAPRGYLRIWMEGTRRPISSSAGGELNSGLFLSASGDGVYLFNAAGQLVNSVVFGAQVPDQTIGWESGGWRLLAKPTPGLVNSGPAVLGSLTNLHFNEWLAEPVTGPDWFEIYNADLAPVALGGAYLTDDPSIRGQTNHVVAPLTFIAGHGYALWTADGDVAQGPNHVGFKLDGWGETLRLYGPDRTLIEAVDFGSQMPGVSEGRWPDGGPDIIDFPGTETPGVANSLTPRDAMRLVAANAEGGKFNLRFMAQPGRAYRVEVCDSLAEPEWRLVGEVVAAPAGREVGFPVTAEVGNARFFRLLMTAGN